MQITVTEDGSSVTRVLLVGKLDIAGADKIDLPLATVAGNRNSVVIDMSGVDFIASIGIRHLVIASKAILRANKILILLKPTEMVTDVLVMSGLTDILPIATSEEQVRALIAGRDMGTE